MHDDCPLGAQLSQHTRDRLNKVRPWHAYQLMPSVCGIRERPEDIKYRANADFAPRPRRVPHRRMVFGREHETDTRSIDAMRDLLRFKLYCDARRLQHVSRATGGRCSAVAMLGDPQPRSRRNQRRRQSRY